LATGPAKKAGGKKVQPAASPAKSSPTKAERKRTSLDSNDDIEVRDGVAHCRLCDAILAKTSPSEVVRHKNSRACKMAAGAHNGAPAAGSDSADIVADAADIDPLDVDAGTGVGDVVNDIVDRTCQYCGKVVEDVKDLAGHYSTKGCMAKKYQMENGSEASNGAEADDDTEQIVPNTNGGKQPETTPAWIFDERADGAPNVVVENIDQVDGFSAL
jgi:hypothetical protein